MRRDRIVLVALVLGLTSCAAESKESNEKYLDYLASLVLGYQDRHGSLPSTFSQAHDDSGVILPNRGDKYGRSLFYSKCGDRGFMFRSEGRNHRDDLGLGDDVDIYYVDRKRVTRDEFIGYLKTTDHGDLWKIYNGVVF